MNSMVKSILMYGSESGTITEKIQRKLEAFEMKCYRRLLGISWRERRSNDYVWTKIMEIFQNEHQKPEAVMQTVTKRKLTFFGHQVRRGKITKNLIQDSCEGIRTRGRPKRNWQNDITDWTGLNLQEACHRTYDRKRWRKDVISWVHQRPNRPRS